MFKLKKKNILAKKIFVGLDIQPQGLPCGKGLSAGAANDLDLDEGMAVAVSMIDAHCGTIGKFWCIIRRSD